MLAPAASTKMSLKYNSTDNSWDKRNFQKHFRSQWFRSKRKLTSFLVVALSIILFCLLGYFVSSSDAADNKDTLRLMHILFRHGARNPNHSYKTDPHKNHAWADGLGALTNKGKLQMYETGQKFRKYYGKFIPEEYMENDVLITSSAHSRTLMSAYTFLAGLYPPAERQKWHPNLNWQPIPVTSVPRTSDKIIAARKPCSKFDELYQKILAKISAQPQYQDIFDYLTLHTNETTRDILAVEMLHGTLLVQKEMGLELPEWTNAVYPGKMLEMSQLSMAAFTYDADIKKFRGGPILEDIMNHMEAKIDATLSPDRKLFLYSGHDVTVVNLWRTLSMNELILPEYGASIAIELHEHPPGDFIVETYYWNNTEAESPMKLNLPICNNPCTFGSFKNAFSEYIPADWDAECGNTLH